MSLRTSSRVFSRLALAAAAPSLAVAMAVVGCSSASPASNGATSGGDTGGTVGGTYNDAGVFIPDPTSSADGGASATATGDAQVAPGNLSVTFLTTDTSQYLAAGDGGALVASNATPGTTGTFSLIKLGAGSLADGDLVRLATSTGAYLSAADGGGGALAFSTTSPGDDETFILTRVDAPGPIAAGDHVALKTKVTGNYVSAVNGGGGQVLANQTHDEAWETFTLGIVGAASGASDAGAPASDAGSAASAARQKVLAFLAGISGKQTAIGVEDKDSSNPTADSQTMASMANDGKNPSFWSADFGFGSAVGERENIVQAGEKQWASGAIVQYIYHACPLSWGANEQCEYQGGTDPIDGSFSDLSAAQWTDLTTAGGTLNGVWLARLDVLAGFFQELKDAGVAPLFRPLHEINASSANGGGWAWWQGRPGPTGSAKLYQITHDYLVKTKGLDNIIWVWNMQDYSTLASDAAQYTPGADYFDIAALDVYNTGYTSGNYNAMVGAAGGKPIGVAECEFLPSTSVLQSQPLWTYVAMWPDFFSDDTSQIPALFGDSQVVTLSSMPGWN